MKRKQKARDNAAARIVQLDELAQQSERYDFEAHLAAGGQLIVDLEHLLESDPAEGRRVLRTLLVGPIAVTPKETAGGTVFEYRADCRLDTILADRIGTSAEILPATMLVPPG